MLKVFEAFSGYGGASFALKKLSLPFEIVGFSEIDKYATQCFHQNHKNQYGGLFAEIQNYGDITKIDWKKVSNFDLLTGGFPCQDVSLAGKRNLSKGRTILAFELTKALIAQQPKMFLFENVKGILSEEFKPFLKECLKQWRNAGYVVQYGSFALTTDGFKALRSG